MEEGSGGIGLRIREARVARGLKQDALAEAIGVVTQIVKDYEGGRKRPGIDKLPALAAALGVSIDALFHDAAPREFSARDSVAAPKQPRPVEHPLSEATLMDALGRQQQLLAEQQAMMERQRQDIARLTELLARQQEAFIAERQFQQRLVSNEMDKLKATVERLEGEIARARGGRGQLLDSPTRPGRVGER
jgi:transcriptional regulator with XRE-family HTH domain